MKSLMLAALAALTPVSLMAADENVKADGVIGAIHIAQDGQDFRVSLENNPALCGNSWTTSYLSSKDANYATFVQALLAAKASKAKVTLLSKKDADGYCKLIYLILQ